MKKLIKSFIPGMKLFISIIIDWYKKFRCCLNIHNNYKYFQLFNSYFDFGGDKIINEHSARMCNHCKEVEIDIKNKDWIYFGSANENVIKQINENKRNIIW